MSTFPPNDEWA